MKLAILAALVLKFGPSDNVTLPHQFWLVAVPCVGFVLFLVVDGIVVRIKKRRLYKMQVTTNEISRLDHLREHESELHSIQQPPGLLH